MPAEAIEAVQDSREMPAAAPLEMPSMPSTALGAPGFRRTGSGIEFAAFLLVMVIVALYCWPSEDDLASLETAVLYAALLNSN